MTALSLRRLWTIYKRTALAQGTGANRRDLALSQLAFYSGARGVLRVLDHMIQWRLPRLQRFDAVNNYKESAGALSPGLGCQVQALRTASAET